MSWNFSTMFVINIIVLAAAMKYRSMCFIFVWRNLLRLKLYNSISGMSAADCIVILIWTFSNVQRSKSTRKLLNATMKTDFVCFIVVILWLSTIPLIISLFGYQFRLCVEMLWNAFSCENTRQRHRDHILFRLYVIHQIKKKSFSRHFSLNSLSFVVK